MQRALAIGHFLLLFLLIAKVKGEEPTQVILVSDGDQTIWLKIHSEHRSDRAASGYLSPDGLFRLSLHSPDRYFIAVRTEENEGGRSAAIHLRRPFEENPKRNPLRMNVVERKVASESGGDAEAVHVVRFQFKDENGDMQTLTEFELQAGP